MGRVVVDKVRSRLQGGRWKEVKSRALFRSRYTLLKSAENLIDRERLNLEELFSMYPELKYAWRLKEGFRRWYRTATRAEAEEGLGIFEKTIIDGTFPEFKHLQLLSRNGDKRYPTILITALPMALEGKNNRINTIKEWLMATGIWTTSS
jgi:hypothetical protein